MLKLAKDYPALMGLGFDPEREVLTPKWIAEGAKATDEAKATVPTLDITVLQSTDEGYIQRWMIAFGCKQGAHTKGPGSTRLQRVCGRRGLDPIDPANDILLRHALELDHHRELGAQLQNLTHLFLHTDLPGSSVHVYEIGVEELEQILAVRENFEQRLEASLSHHHVTK